MKASELTIGSWVKATDNGAVPLPSEIAKMLPRAGKVVAINGDTVVLDFVDFGFMLDAIEPVPLTTEILENNGFIYNDNPVNPAFEGHGLYIFSHWKSGYSVNVGVWRSIEFSSVHELQNALRLCGIEKEIEL